MRMPFSVLILIFLDLILAGLALYGGINLMLDPTGTTLAIDPALVYIPFVTDFMLFGIWLVVAFAALPIILSYLIYIDNKAGLYGSLALAALEIVWIATQIVLLYPLGLSNWWPAIMVYSIIVAAIAASSLYIVFRGNTRTYFHWYAPRTREAGPK